jgi:hypothetical protein
MVTYRAVVGSVGPPVGLEKVIGTLPFSWRANGCRKAGERVAPAELAGLLANDPCWMGEWRTEVARGIGEHFGCGDAALFTDREGANITSCREIIETLAGADRALVASFVEGLGYNAELCRERSGRESVLAFRHPYWDDVSDRRRADPLFQCALNAMPEAAAYAAFVHGIGRFMGEDPVDMVASSKYFSADRPPPGVFPVEPREERFRFDDARRAFDDGMAQGQADMLIAYVHGFHAHPLLQPLASLEKWMAARHVRLTPRAEPPGLYFLEVSSQESAVSNNF